MELLEIKSATGNPRKKYGILGVPWDEDASHGRPGSRFAPEVIRRNAQWIFDRIEENQILDLEDFRLIDLKDIEVKDFGNILICSYDHFETKKRVREQVRSFHENGYVPVLLGGDCSITYPQIEALCEANGLPYARINAPGDLFDDPHLRGSGGLLPVTLPDGRASHVPALPVAMGGARLPLRLDLPAPGQHTAAILGED